LIMDFVETFFSEDDLKQFVKYFHLDKVVKVSDYKADPIVKHGGLQAMLACFLKNNKQALKDFKAHLAGGSSAETKKKAPAKKQESSESESSSESEADESSESEEEKKPVKKIVGQKRKAKESSSSSSSEEGESDSDDDKKKKAKKTVANGGPANKRQRADSISSRTRGHSDVKEAETFKAPMKPPNPNFKFQRINEDKFN